MSIKNSFQNYLSIIFLFLILFLGTSLKERDQVYADHRAVAHHTLQKSQGVFSIDLGVAENSSIELDNTLTLQAYVRSLKTVEDVTIKWSLPPEVTLEAGTLVETISLEKVTLVPNENGVTYEDGVGSGNGVISGNEGLNVNRSMNSVLNEKVFEIQVKVKKWPQQPVTFAVFKMENNFKVGNMKAVYLEPQPPAQFSISNKGPGVNNPKVHIIY